MLLLLLLLIPIKTMKTVINGAGWQSEKNRRQMNERIDESVHQAAKCEVLLMSMSMSMSTRGNRWDRQHDVAVEVCCVVWQYESDLSCTFLKNHTICVRSVENCAEPNRKCFPRAGVPCGRNQRSRFIILLIPT